MCDYVKQRACITRDKKCLYVHNLIYLGETGSAEKQEMNSTLNY